MIGASARRDGPTLLLSGTAAGRGSASQLILGDKRHTTGTVNMLRKNLMPLRVITGDAIPIDAVEVVARSAEAQSLDVSALVRDSPSGIRADPQYATFLPRISDGAATMEPARGMATFPDQLDLPFAGDVRFASFFGSGLPVQQESGVLQDLSRALWVEIDIEFPPSLVGGVLFSGFPYAPYELTGRGEVTSNFGLPREIRVSWSSTDEVGFLDAESALTDQSIVSHGGLHILPTGPVTTNRLRLRLADFPRFVNELDTTTTPPGRRQFWGFVIPVFYVFEHAERTRYRPSVRGGLVAAAVVSEGESSAVGVEASAIGGSAASGYISHNAASLFRRGRGFLIGPFGGLPPVRERFISRHVEPGQEVRIYFEQAEEYERCLSGLRLHFSDRPGPDGNQCNTLRASVYELDPLEGESTLLLKLGDKYTDLLVSADIDRERQDAGETIPLRFVRSSSSRHFALVLKNVSNADGVVMMEAVELVQSADVAVAPRQSRSQVIRTLHMRLIGPQLAEDYSRIGPEAFTLSIERLVAGAQKDVLFAAESLLDLLQSGMARIYPNQRRRATEAELIELDTRDGNPSFELRRNQAGSTGWRRAESGDGVDKYVAENLPTEFQNWRDQQMSTANGTTGQPYGFNTFGNQESRVHTESVFPRSADGNEWQSAAVWVNGLAQVADLSALLGGEKLVNDTATNTLERRNWQHKPRGILNPVWEQAIWRGLSVPDVLGMRILTISPFSPIASLGQLVNDLQPLARDATRLLRRFGNGQALDVAALDATIDSLDALTDLLRAMFFGPHLWLNTSSVGLSASPGGIGVSISGPSPFPSINNSASVGSTGTISMQAVNTGYSYAQHLSSAYEEGTSRTDFLSSTLKRIIRRSALTAEDTQRIQGAEVMWQQQLVDILTVSIPLNVTLPATAGRAYRTSDDSIRVRFGNSVRDTVSVDVWFDIAEEGIPHDH
jgi:hypothetical protein